MFRTVSDLIGPRVSRIPDGETGSRSNWIRWQADVFRNSPDFELTTAEGGGYARRALFAFRPGTDPAAVSLGPLGYSAAARGSFQVFAALAADGVVAPGTRFQVSLPTPVAVTTSFVVPADQAAVESVYRTALLAELGDVLGHLPAGRLTNSSGGWPISATPSPPRCGSVITSATATPNGIAGKLNRPLDFLHLPVPKDRADPAYFAPLAGLSIPAETELFLGLVHLTDGLPGALRRVSAARAAREDFGIATECGFGRRPPDTVPELLALHRSVLDAVS